MQKRTFVPGTGTNFMPREFSHGAPGLGPNAIAGWPEAEEMFVVAGALRGTSMAQVKAMAKRTGFVIPKDTLIADLDLSKSCKKLSAHEADWTWPSNVGGNADFTSLRGLNAIAADERSLTGIVLEVPYPHAGPTSSPL